MYRLFSPFFVAIGTAVCGFTIEYLSDLIYDNYTLLYDVLVDTPGMLCGDGMSTKSRLYEVL